MPSSAGTGHRTAVAKGNGKRWPLQQGHIKKVGSSSLSLPALVENPASSVTATAVCKWAGGAASSPVRWCRCASLTGRGARQPVAERGSVALRRLPERSAVARVCLIGATAEDSAAGRSGIVACPAPLSLSSHGRSNIGPCPEVRPSSKWNQGKRQGVSGTRVRCFAASRWTLQFKVVPAHTRAGAGQTCTKYLRMFIGMNTRPAPRRSTSISSSTGTRVPGLITADTSPRPTMARRRRLQTVIQVMCVGTDSRWTR